VALVLVRIAVRPAEIPAAGHRDDLVGRVLVDVGLDDPPEGVRDAAVSAVKGIGDVVAVVDRRPTVPAGATASPSPLRTPVSTTRGIPPPGGTASIVARGGAEVRSPGLALEELPTLK